MPNDGLFIGGRCWPMGMLGNELRVMFDDGL
jgi:hypothetical protein